MISGTDINDYRQDNPQQLWQLADQRGKDKYIEMQGMVFKYGWLDGMYVTVYDLQGNQYTVAAWTECWPLSGKPPEGTLRGQEGS
jgi:hypothetical protein